MNRPPGSLEQLAAAAAAGARAADGPGGLVGALAPARVLEIGSSGGRAAAAALGAGVRAWVAIDPDGASVAAARRRLADAGARVRWFHAAIRPVAGGPRHFTRDPELVALLREDGFDCVLVHAAASADALYTDLAHALPLVRGRGVVVCHPAARATAAFDAVRRLAGEGSCRAVVAGPPDGGGETAFLALRAAYRTHAETTELRRVVAADDPAVPDAFARADHETVVARLRHWLAARLAWATADLRLPLAALPPPLGVLDVVEQGALGEGGVDACGAAVTLAMLYRAWGYAATVYSYGVPGVWTHAVTLVGAPDRPLLVQDALLDVEPREGGRPVPWASLVTRARAGDPLAGVRLAHGGLGTRAHLYSRASLEASERGGWLDAGERAALAATMRTVERVAGETRAAIPQARSCSPAAVAAIPAHARALAALAARTGRAHPAALLALPYGTLPLTGVARFDDELARVLAAPAAAPGATAPAEAVR
jgi:predicted RNA methylase